VVLSGNLASLRLSFSRTAGDPIQLPSWCTHHIGFPSSPDRSGGSLRSFSRLRRNFHLWKMKSRASTFYQSSSVVAVFWKMQSVSTPCTPLPSRAPHAVQVHLCPHHIRQDKKRIRCKRGKELSTGSEVRTYQRRSPFGIVQGRPDAQCGTGAGGLFTNVVKNVCYQRNYW
jgi:hypothetical protein